MSKIIVFLAVMIGAVTASQSQPGPKMAAQPYGPQGAIPGPRLGDPRQPYPGYPDPRFPNQRFPNAQGYGDPRFPSRFPNQGFDPRFPNNQRYPNQGFDPRFPNQRFPGGQVDPRYPGQAYPYNQQGGLNYDPRYPNQRFPGGQYPGAFSRFPNQRFPNGAQGYSPDGGATILRTNSESDLNGNFRYGFETSNGIQADAEGFIKNPGAYPDDQIQAIVGSYSHYTPDGAFVSVTYTADENGYKPRTKVTRQGDPGFGAVAGPVPPQGFGAGGGPAPPHVGLGASATTSSRAAVAVGSASPANLYYGTNPAPQPKA